MTNLEKKAVMPTTQIPYFFVSDSFFFSQDYPILWGICAPKQCSEEDVTNALQIFSGTFTSSQKLTWIIETGTCLPADKKPLQSVWRILHARAWI